MPFERWFYAWRVRLRMFIDRDRVDRDLDDELRHHVALETEARTAQGIPPAEARRQALATFGGLESARNGVHEARFGAALEQILQDVKYALRSLSRARGFALVGVVTVALGIGASTAVFSVVDAVLLNPLPFPRAERIVTVWQFDAAAAVEREVSPGNFLEWRDRSTAFDAIAAVEPSGVDLVSEGEPQNLRIWRVSEGFFDLLGVPAQHGRTFTADEHRPGADGAVVLSQRFWQQRFGGDPGVVGRTLTLSERRYVVVGVMPQQFDYPPGRDLWMSRAFTEDDRQNRGGLFLNVIARLAPGVSVDAARVILPHQQHPTGAMTYVVKAGGDPGAIVSAVQAAVWTVNPELPFRPVITLQGLVDSSIAPRQFVLALMSVFGVVGLFLASVGMFGLIKYLVERRTRELGLRMALGAAPQRLVRGLIGEGLRLAATGALIGVVGALGLTRLLSTLLFGIPSTDPASFVGAIVVVLIVAGLASYLPARKVVAASPMMALQSQ